MVHVLARWFARPGYPVVTMVDGRSAAFTALLWMAAVLVALVLAVVVLAGVRRWFRGVGNVHEPTFTLEELQQMRDRGDVTEHEYAALRRTLIDRMVREKPGGPPRAHRNIL